PRAPHPVGTGTRGRRREDRRAGGARRRDADASRPERRLTPRGDAGPEHAAPAGEGHGMEAPAAGRRATAHGRNRFPRRRRVVRDHGRELEAHPQRGAAPAAARVRAVRLLPGSARREKRRHRAPGRGRAPDEESRTLTPDAEVREAEARQRADQGNDQGAARPAPQPGLREVAGARAEHSDGKGMTPSRRQFLAGGAAAAASTLASPARAQWQPSPRYPDPSIKI